MAQEITMKSRGRVLILAVSIPIIVFAVVGGFMSKASAREDSYQYLRIFEDVVTLIVNNYVEEMNVDKVMHGAMHGLADGLDPDQRVPRRRAGQDLRQGRHGAVRLRPASS